MTQNFGVYFRLQKVAMVGETENTHKLIILSMIYPFFPKMIKMGKNDKISAEWVKNRSFSFYKNCKKCIFFQLIEKMVAPVYRGQTPFFDIFFEKFSGYFFGYFWFKYSVNGYFIPAFFRNISTFISFSNFSEKMVAPVYRGQPLFFGFFSKFSRSGFWVK